MAILLQAAVTLAMAIASYFLIEQPIRRGDMITGTFARIAAPIGAVVLIAVTFTVTGTFTLEPELDLASAKSELEKTTQRAVPDDATADALPTVAFYGDSTGLMAALGVADWSIEKGHLHVVPGVVDLGCTPDPPGHHALPGSRLVLAAGLRERRLVDVVASEPRTDAAGHRGHRRSGPATSPIGCFPVTPNGARRATRSTTSTSSARCSLRPM